MGTISSKSQTIDDEIDMNNLLSENNDVNDSSVSYIDRLIDNLKYYQT